MDLGPHDEQAMGDSSVDASETSEEELSEQEEQSWISWFCSIRGNEFFAEVDEEYIQDEFNLTGLSAEVPYFDYALDTILDVDSPNADQLTEEQQETVDAAAELLYGLIHARYILTSKGLNAMYDKFMDVEFGRCPRVLCGGQPLLPVGQADQPRKHTVSLYCPRCSDIYYPRSSRHANVDGAYFGTTFPHLFLMTFPQCVPEPAPEPYVPRVFGFRIRRAPIPDTPPPQATGDAHEAGAYQQQSLPAAGGAGDATRNPAAATAAAVASRATGRPSPPAATPSPVTGSSPTTTGGAGSYSAAATAGGGSSSAAVGQRGSSGGGGGSGTNYTTSAGAASAPVAPGPSGGKPGAAAGARGAAAPAARRGAVAGQLPDGPVGDDSGKPAGNDDEEEDEEEEDEDGAGAGGPSGSPSSSFGGGGKPSGSEDLSSSLGRMRLQENSQQQPQQQQPQQQPQQQQQQQQQHQR